MPLFLPVSTHTPIWVSLLGTLWNSRSVAMNQVFVDRACGYGCGCIPARATPCKRRSAPGSACADPTAKPAQAQARATAELLPASLETEATPESEWEAADAGPPGSAAPEAAKDLEPDEHAKT